MAKLTPEGEKARARVAKWIKLYKELSGSKSDQEFAATLGIGKSTLSELQSGKGSLGFDTVRLLRERYLASIDDILDRDPDASDTKHIKSTLAALRSHNRAAG